MAFRGFLTESKSFMNYPKCGRLKFWLGLPRAWLVFHWYVVKDSFR